MSTDIAKPKHPVFVLDSCAMIGYAGALKPKINHPPAGASGKEIKEYHQKLLALWGVINERIGASGTDPLPIRIPDYIFYEQTGVLPITLKAMQVRVKELARNPDANKRSIAYDDLITLLVDSSVRSDRKTWKNATGSYNEKEYLERRSELYNIFTLFAFHPEIVSSTNVGKEFCQSVKIESAVVAGVGTPTKKTETVFAEQIKEINKSVRDAAGNNVKPDIAHYTLTFGDVKAALPKFDPSRLRVHWGQLYFMGLINEGTYRTKLDDDPLGTDFYPARSSDDNLRFVTVGKLNALGNGHKFHVKGEKGDYVTFGMLPGASKGRKHFQLEAALPPAKITIDQLIFGDVLASTDEIRNKKKHVSVEKDYAAKAVKCAASALGYTIPKTDSYEEMHQQLKHDGFFERFVSVEDLVRIRVALNQQDFSPRTIKKLDDILDALPARLATRSRELNTQASREQATFPSRKYLPMGW
jgi:hypothetical protein